MMTPELEKQYKDALQKALNVGYAIIENRGYSIHAVEKAVKWLEDSQLFNAGKGSVFTASKSFNGTEEVAIYSSLIFLVFSCHLKINFSKKPIKAEFFIFTRINQIFAFYRLF